MSLFEATEQLTSIYASLEAGNITEARTKTEAALTAAHEAEEAYMQHCEAEELANQAWLQHGAELEEVPW